MGLSSCGDSSGATTGKDGGISGPTPKGAVSANVPGATFTNVSGTPQGQALVLLSARLTYEAPLTTVYQEWLAEVVNQGSRTLCLTKVSAAYKNAAGVVVAAPYGYIEGKAYQMDASTVSIGCLAPGEHGALWDMDTVPTVVDLATVKTVEILVEPYEVASAVPHPAAPVISGTVVVPKYTTSYVLTGVATGVQPIHNIGFAIYPRGADGMILDHLSATNLGSLSAGEVWSWESMSVKQPFATWMLFSSFITGLSSNHAPVSVDPAVQDRLDDWQAGLTRIQAASAARAADRKAI